MATEDIRVTHPIEIKPDSEARVAYDLMVFISHRETIDEATKKSRDHWLTLYLQCRRAAREASLSSILQPK